MKKVFNRVKNNKKLRIIGISILVLFAALITRITFAFFAPDINSGFANVNAGNDTVDILKFEVGDPLSFNVNSSTLPESGANLVKNTTAKAILRANSTNNEASYDYYLYLELADNTFVYSDGSTPEIILSVTDPNGNPVTSINGLNYGTFSGIEGFDVTTANGVYLLGNSIITSNSSTTDTISEWQISLTYLNLPIDQSINYGHSMTTKLMMQKNAIKTFANYITSLYTTQGANNLYHHNGTITATVANTITGVAVGDVIDSGDGSYRYAGSSDTTNNYVCFGQIDETGAYVDGWCDADNLYRIIGVFNDPILDADGNPTDVIQQRVKLIKSTLATSALLGTDGDYGNDTSYFWSYRNSSLANTEKGKYNLWSYSELNKINLNKNYLTNIGTKWSAMIDESIWYVGGMTLANGVSSSTAKKAFTYELGENKNIITPYEPVTKTKVGLMYLSEYYYSANPNFWTYPGLNSGDTSKDYRVAAGENWMFLGTLETTISPSLDDSYRSFIMSSVGNTNNGMLNNSQAVRPSFSLKPDVTFAGGTGTASDPYRIS